MPSSATITAFNTFSPGTKARATEVNANFNLFRGHLLPIDPNTATATDNTYDLGTEPWRFRTLYTNTLDVETSTSTAGVIVRGDVAATSGAFVITIGGVEQARVRGDGSNSITPSGVILAFGGTAAPTGFLMCNGASVSRTTYATLYAVIGTAYGSNTVTSFNVPDFRGRFLRGVDSGQARDPNAATRTAMNTGGATGDTVGSIQADATKKNGLVLSDPGHKHSFNTPAGGASNFSPNGASDSFSIADNNVINSNTTGITLSGGDSETRPLNASVNYIIKT